MSPSSTATTITILGSGTSTGVPLIGCDCAVCTSTDPRNKRSRASILISCKEGNILIDTSTDLRFQALSNNIRRISAVLYTHAHADHIHGIDELSIPHVRQRREEKEAKRTIPGYKPRRWVVEVAHSWFNRFRKILVRYEKLDYTYEALLHLAAAIIAFRKAGVIYG